MGKNAVFIVKGQSFEGMEGQTGLRVCRLLLREGGNKDIDIFCPDADSPVRIKEILSLKGYETFIVISGILYITYDGACTLSKILKKRRELSLIAPVSNESDVACQRSAPPFLYQTISVFKWATEHLQREIKDSVREVDTMDDFCFAFRAESLDGLPGDSNIMDLPKLMKGKGARMGVAQGVYVHRYGNCYESGRDDVMACVPPGAVDILDVGCARGFLGELLKKRQKCIVTGVEVDMELMNISANRLDKVISGDIEDLLDKEVLGKYDCIVCGDVLEHLNNPWKVVGRLKSHLREGGLFIASTPNIMNWAIISDQLKGRWDYVPFSILSGTHIRFFTRDTLVDLFEDAGYKIREVQLQSFEIPPRGLEFIAGLKKENEINEEEVKAHEILVVAEG